jgi:PAS domain S-box-containing protein
MNNHKKKKEERSQELVSLRRMIQIKEKSETKTSRAKEEQQESDEKYKALIETTHTGYLILDLEGRVVDANREYVRLSGHRRLNEILGRTVIEWTAEHDRERNKIEVARCLERGFVRGLEVDYVDKKGLITPIEIQATVIRKGPTSYILSLCRNITERKRTEKALRLSQEKLSKAFLASPDWMSISTLDEGRYMDVNESYLRMIGYRRDEVVGRTSREISLWTASDDREKGLEIIQKNGRLTNFETRFRMKSGEIRDMLWSAEVIELEGKKCILSVCHDITERNQMEKALRLSEEKLSKAFLASPDWITIATLEEGRYIDVNESFLRMTGYRRDEIIGRTSVEINLWEHVDDRGKGLAILKKKGRLTNLELKCRMKSGKMRDMLWSAELIELEGRKCILSVGRDITERKLMEDALRLSEEKYQLLVNNANLGVEVCQDLMIKFANPKAAEITGYSQDELRLKPLLELVHPEDHEIVKERTAKRLRGEFVEPKNTYKALKKNGQTQWVELNAVASSWEGRPAVLYFFQDVTEIKKAREDLLKAKEELELKVEERTVILKRVNEKLQKELIERKRIENALKKSEKKLRRLSDQLINAQEKERRRISIELHDDLGQSLVGLKFQLCNLPKKLKQDQKALKTTIEKALIDLDEMTEKVRRLSKDLHPAVLEHLGLFEALQWLFEDSSLNYRIKINNELENSDFSFSKEQEINIFRLFQEALTNIGKHANATEVLIEVSQNEIGTVFSIKDDGRGFDPKAVMGRKPSEIGLGLAAMDERIRLIGGTLKIQSEIRRGTTITFSIPTGKKKISGKRREKRPGHAGFLH